MNYRKIIAEVAKGNTVRAFYYRMSMIRTAMVTKIAATDILFEFDKEADKMIVKKDGQQIAEYHGDESWGKAIEDFRRMLHRRELDPKTTRFLFRGPKGLVDVKNEFLQAA